MKFSALYHDPNSKVYLLVDATATEGRDGVRVFQGPMFHFSKGDPGGDFLKQSLCLGVSNLKNLVNELSNIHTMSLSRSVHSFEYELPLLEVHGAGDRDTLAIAVFKNKASADDADLTKLIFKRHSITTVERGGVLGKLEYSFIVTRDFVEDLKWLMRYYEPSFI